jgi:putative ABC transport system ATP-binding protein
VREILVVVDLENDVYRLGLRSRLSGPPSPDLESRILAARDDLYDRLRGTKCEHYVETFDPERYTVNASVMENLVFGVAVPEALGGTRLEDHPFMISTIAETGLETRLFGMGLNIAETLIDLFGGLASDNPLLERMDLMAPEEIDQYRGILRRIGTLDKAAIDRADRQAMLKLAFGYVEPRHRLGLLDAAMQAEIVAARRTFRDKLPPALSDGVKFYQPGALNPAASIQDNVLFGRMWTLMRKRGTASVQSSARPWTRSV